MDPEGRPTLAGRSLTIALLGAIVVFLALVVWLGVTGGGRKDATPAVSASPLDPVARNAGSIAPLASERGFSPIKETVSDKHVRDELRRRILAGWAQGDTETAAAARAGRFLPAPTSDGGGMDPDYIRSVMRSEFVPMAKKCYEELLTRDAKASGKLVFDFTIAGDESLGGIVESAELNDKSTLKDEKLSTCMRESLMTVAFRPPAHGGVVTVTMPVVLVRDGPDE